ncbi:phenylacetate--CoA ligase family protein [Acidobacteriota bacterium]
MINNLRALHQVMHDRKLARSKLDKVIHKRLKEVLVSAYLHVPYYRESMQSAGYNPNQDYSGSQDLGLLPVTTKVTIKEAGIQAFLNENADLLNCFSDTTSGSTGIPLRLYQSSYGRAIHIARWLRVLFVNGYSIHDKVMALVNPKRLSVGRSSIQKLGVFRRLVVNYILSPEEQVDILLDYKPDVLYGNCSLLDLMALELEKRRIQPKNLKLVIGTGNVIHNISRQLCYKNFGVELTESYGSVEMGVMAYETPAYDGLHLCEDLTYFEFLDEEGNAVPPGQPGRVVVTDLTGKVMPLIRYDHKDLAVFADGDNKSDANPRRLLRVIGREIDYVLLPEGARLTAWHLDSILCKYENIKQFCSVYKAPNLIQVQIVADHIYVLSIRESLMSRLKKMIPPKIKIEIVQVDRIESDPGGKFRTLIAEKEK